MRNKKFEHTTPLGLLVGHLPSVSKSDALDFIRAQADKYLGEFGENLIYYDMVSWNEGYLYIITAGGDRLSRVRSLAKFLDENKPGTRVRFDTASRNIEVFIKSENDPRLISYIMPEDDTLDGVTPLEPKGKMIRLQNDYMKAMIIGSVVFASGLLSLALVSLVLNLNAGSEMAKMQKTQQDLARDLPSWHLPSSVGLLPGQYIEQMRFVAGRWQEPVKQCGTDECHKMVGDKPPVVNPELTQPQANQSEDSPPPQPQVQPEDNQKIITNPASRRDLRKNKIDELKAVN